MSRQNTKRPSLTNQDTVDSSMINLPAPPPIPASLLDSDILEDLVSQYRMALMEAIRNHNQENRKLKNVEKSLSTSTSVEDSTEESSTPLVESPKSSISTLAKKIILPTIAKKPSSTQVTIRKVSSKSQQLAPETFTADDRTSYDGSTSSEVFCNINRSKLKPARKNPESNMGNVNELTEKLKTTVDINSDNPPSMMASDVADVVLSEDHLRLMQEIRNPNKKPLNSAVPIKAPLPPRSVLESEFANKVLSDEHTCLMKDIRLSSKRKLRHVYQSQESLAPVSKTSKNSGPNIRPKIQLKPPSKKPTSDLNDFKIKQKSIHETLVDDSMKSPLFHPQTEVKKIVLPKAHVSLMKEIRNPENNKKLKSIASVEKVPPSVPPSILNSEHANDILSDKRSLLMEEIRIGPKRKLRTYYQSHESLAPESKFSKKSELNVRPKIQISPNQKNLPSSSIVVKKNLKSKQESESTHSPDNPMKPKIKLQFSDKNQSSIKPVFKIPKNSEAPSLRKPLTPLAKLSPTVKKLPIRVNIVGGKQKELIVPPTNVPQAPPPPPPRELSRDVAKLVLSNDRSDLMKEIRKGAKLKPAVPAAPPPPPASLLQNPETANVVLNGDRATLMGDIRKFGQTILKPKTPNNNPEEDSFKQQIHARRRGISSSTDDDENQENVVSNNNNDVSVLSPIDRVKQMPKLLNSNASSKNPSDDEDWK